ncbi:dixin-like [Aplochiton taeniatus]
MIASLSKGSLLDDVLHEGFNEQQLAAYVSWVNSQLKRRPGLKPITDLRHDLQDGVVLIHLIEIVAGEVLEGVHLVPKDREESRENVERVLQLISSKGIRMPHTSARDIVDGNLKSVMRLILALAAHFKPSANHRSPSSNGRGPAGASANHRPLSTVAMAQSAAAALVAARHDALRPARHTYLRSGWTVDDEGSVCVRALVQQYERSSSEEQEASQPGSLSSPSPAPSPKVGSSQSEDREQNDEQKQKNHNEPAHDLGQTVWEDPLTETLEKEMQETRRMVSALQALLLNGSLPEDDQELSQCLGEDNAEQQLVVIRSRLDQSMEEAQELKRELLRCKQDMRNLQGVKEAQQQRLLVQEASVLQMKQELLRGGMARDELKSQNAELQRKLEERTKLLNDYKKELGQKDRLLQQHKLKLEESQQLKPAEELQLVRDALRSLRNNLREHDPQHHTLDTLEQGIGSLTDRLHVLHTHRGKGKSPGHKAMPTEQDSWPRTKMSHSHSSPVLSPSACTKLLYFAGHSLTPFMINIPKRLGEVTLRDVKSAVDREGNYRYHFKALDPEFGTVKEEVFLDEAIVPGWEGKIVAWVEEDHGEERP